MLKIFIMLSNIELFIYNNMRKIIITMTKIYMVSLVCLCVLLVMKTENTFLKRYLDIVNHKNCRCNVDHTKESYAE